MNINFEKLEKYATEYKVPIITKDGIEYIKNYIKEKQITNILEIGTAIGYSALQMANVNKNVKITTIERNKESYEVALKNIKTNHKENQITAYNIDAEDFKTAEKFDLIFIDAAKAQNIKFFNKFKKNLKNNGTIITDNLNFHGLVNENKIKSRNLRQLVRKIKEYKTFLEKNIEFETIFLDIGDGLSISIKR